MRLRADRRQQRAALSSTPFATPAGALQPSIHPPMCPWATHACLPACVSGHIRRRHAGACARASACQHACACLAWPSPLPTYRTSSPSPPCHCNPPIIQTYTQRAARSFIHVHVHAPLPFIQCQATCHGKQAACACSLLQPHAACPRMRADHQRERQHHVVQVCPWVTCGRVHPKERCSADVRPAARARPVTGSDQILPVFCRECCYFAASAVHSQEHASPAAP